MEYIILVYIVTFYYLYIIYQTWNIVCKVVVVVWWSPWDKEQVQEGSCLWDTAYFGRDNGLKGHKQQQIFVPKFT